MSILCHSSVGGSRWVIVPQRTMPTAKKQNVSLIQTIKFGFHNFSDGVAFR